MDFTLDDIEINQEEITPLKVEKLKGEISMLKSKLNYSPQLRNSLLTALAGYLVGGVFGAIAGGSIGYFISRDIETTDVDIQVIKNLLTQKQNELAEILRSQGVSQEEIDGIMSSEALIKHQYDCYDFTGKWEALIGLPAKGFHAMIFGLPKAGKSYLSVQFAKYLSDNFGKTLYIASEEGFSKTLQKKIQEYGGNKNLFFANFREYDQIKQALENDAFEFVFIDSVNFIKIEPEQVEELKGLNPHSSFVTIQQATKEGQFRGSQEFAHNCDIIIKVDAGIAHQQGRFQEPSEMPVFDGPKVEENKEGTQVFQTEKSAENEDNYEVQTNELAY